MSHLFRKIPWTRYFWHIWQNKKPAQGDGEGYDSIDDVQPGETVRSGGIMIFACRLPLPAFKASAAFQIEHPIHQIAREHTGNSAACVENT